MKNIRVLILEDDKEFSQLLTIILQQIGINTVYTTDCPTQCIPLIEQHQLNMCLFDINLNQYVQTGIDVAKSIREFHPDMPIMFLTSLYNEQYYEYSKSAQPTAFLNKQLDKVKIQQAIEFAHQKTTGMGSPSTIYNSTESVFVKVGDNYKSVELTTIQYFTAEKKTIYCVMDDRKYPVRLTLREIEQKLGNHFVRVHRAFVVNTKLIDTVNLVESLIKIRESKIPIGPSYKKQLIHHIPWLG
ncbi:MAG: LytTR family DNA-binding domain-containing protein [Bacteroidota bacterium]